ncbi:MAG: ACT domain-containing protein [Acidobacteria bacterium]|nr:ACT domain-containing protein [Acidobacteriota bacterium]
MALTFRRHAGEFAVCRLAPDAPMPDWALESLFSSVTRTPAELSIVCEASRVPESIQAERGWACLELCGPFPFALTGILASFLKPLAEAPVPIFALSTFDTDWILVPAAKLDAALQALRAAGHNES